MVSRGAMASTATAVGIARVRAARLPLADDAEDAPHRSRHEAGLLVGAVHREGLARAALAVGEDAHLVRVRGRVRVRVRVRVGVRVRVRARVRVRVRARARG